MLGVAILTPQTCPGFQQLASLTANPNFTLDLGEKKATVTRQAQAMTDTELVQEVQEQK